MSLWWIILQWRTLTGDNLKSETWKCLWLLTRSKDAYWQGRLWFSSVLGLFCFAKTSLAYRCIKYIDKKVKVLYKTLNKTFRINKTLKIDDTFSSSGTPRVLAYDKLILTAGPWTNSLLGPEARTKLTMVSIKSINPDMYLYFNRQWLQVCHSYPSLLAMSKPRTLLQGLLC